MHLVKDLVKLLEFTREILRRLMTYTLGISCLSLACESRVWWSIGGPIGPQIDMIPTLFVVLLERKQVEFYLIYFVEMGWN